MVALTASPAENSTLMSLWYKFSMSILKPFAPYPPDYALGVAFVRSYLGASISEWGSGQGHGKVVK